jgi:hypothetical protein
MITRTDILSPPARRIVLITLKDGRQAFIRSLNELEYSEYTSYPWKVTKSGTMEMDPKRMSAQKRLLITLSLCNEAGEPLLSRDDMSAIGYLDGAVVVDLVEKIRQHCGFNDEQSMEDAEKNSGETSA